MGDPSINRIWSRERLGRWTSTLSASRGISMYWIIALLILATGIVAFYFWFEVDQKSEIPFSIPRWLLTLIVGASIIIPSTIGIAAVRINRPAKKLPIDSIHPPVELGPSDNDEEQTKVDNTNNTDDARSQLIDDDQPIGADDSSSSALEDFSLSSVNESKLDQSSISALDDLSMDRVVDTSVNENYTEIDETVLEG